MGVLSKNPSSERERVQFGRRLMDLRMKRNWSQEDVARRVGCTQRAVGYWEEGERLPVIDVAARLAAVFDVPLDTLWPRPAMARGGQQ
jgi:transcriptional regulator with XRE-family HTH domain